MPRPIIALLTDFGAGGHYVAAMKGAILSVCRDVDLIDICHDVPPQDVAAGSIHLLATVPYFPAGTIFLTVVDPGVGSGRAALAARAGGHAFVGPDNGVMGAALDERGVEVVVALDDARFARSAVSPTFEGRDRLGPAAGWIAAGTPVEELGPAVQHYVRLDPREAVALPDRLRGEVVWVDRFGNLVTNISRNAWARASAGRAGDVWVSGVAVGPPVRTYAEAGIAAPCALFGSTEQLEVAVRDGHAATRFNAAPGAVVEVVWR